MADENETALWCVHVVGPDDVYACRSRAHAVIMAADINDKIRQWNVSNPKMAADPNTPSMSAEVEQWRWSAEEHANDVAYHESRGNQS